MYQRYDCLYSLIQRMAHSMSTSEYKCHVFDGFVFSQSSEVSKYCTHDAEPECNWMLWEQIIVVIKYFLSVGRIGVVVFGVCQGTFQNKTSSSEKKKKMLQKRGNKETGGLLYWKKQLVCISRGP